MSDEAVVSEAVEVSFDWRADEYAEVVQLLTREKMRSRGWRIALVAGGVAIAWQLVQIARYTVDTGDLLTGLLSALPWALLVGFLVWVQTKGTGWLAARRVKKLDPRVGNIQMHRINHEGIFVDSGSGTMSLPWSGMSKVVETPKHFLWYWHNDVAHYTPKRALTESATMRLRGLVDGYSPSAG